MRIDGTAIADDWLRDIAVRVRILDTPPHLAAVCVGNDPGLQSFVKLKQKAAQSCGIQFSSYFIGRNGEDEATGTLSWLAEDDGVRGIFVELPLPDSWDRWALLSLIPVEKDVDRISPDGERSYYDGSSGILPPAVRALERVLQVEGVQLGGKQAAVVGQGKLVGKPIAHWLRGRGVPVSVIDIDTAEPAAIAARADLLVCGAGVPGLVTADWVREDAIVIDFGYGEKEGKRVGDVDAASVEKKAALLTPVPGGMGPLVIAATMENLLALATH